jgi:hypothetical protein
MLKKVRPQETRTSLEEIEGLAKEGFSFFNVTSIKREDGVYVLKCKENCGLIIPLSCLNEQSHKVVLRTRTGDSIAIRIAKGQGISDTTVDVKSVNTGITGIDPKILKVLAKNTERMALQQP